MIRPTVARVDLGAIARNFRRITEYLAREARPESRRSDPFSRASSPSSRRTRTAMAPARWRGRSRTPAPICWRAPTSRKARRFAPPACSADILIFGALSVSDLDGLFDCALTPTISTPGAARAVAGRGGEVQAAPPVSPQDRHRHEPARVPVRQPPPDPPRASCQCESGAAGRLHALCDRRRARLAALQRAASPVRARAGRGRRHQPASRQGAVVRRRFRGLGSQAPLRARVQQCRAAEGRARLVRPRPSRPALIRHSSAAARFHDRARAGDDAREPRGRGQGHSSGRRRRLRRAVPWRTLRERSRSCPPGMPTASIFVWRVAARCSSEAAARRSSGRCRWTCCRPTSPASTWRRATRS